METMQTSSPLYQALGAPELAVQKPVIDEINALKQQKNAVILAHNYMTPEIYHGVADFVGDSLALARKATEAEADIIVQCGVHFMAETSKLLNPSKKVLIPDVEAGCSLAEGITAKDVEALRQKHPGVPVVTYVNTSADVKAASDICCTSGNAVQVVEHIAKAWNVTQVIFIPDQYLAQNVAAQTNIDVITHPASCIVHERFTPRDIQEARDENEGLVVIAHPECKKEVVDVADMSGSTAQMIQFVKEKRPVKVMMVTECSMSDNVAAETLDVEFIRPCNLCPYMKKITLPKIRDCLLNESPAIEVDEAVADKARKAVEAMLAV